MLERLGSWAARRHRWVILGWIALTVALGVGAGAWGGSTNDVFRIPGTDSQAAFDVLAQDFPNENLPSATLVFVAPEGSTVQAEQAGIEAALANVAALPHVKTVGDPFKAAAIYREALPLFPGNERGALGVSKNNRIAVATVQYDANAVNPKATLGPDAFDALNDALAPARANGARTAIGGTIADIYDTGGGGIAEHADAIGLLCALVILILAFGSIVAAGMPIGVALVGLGTGLSIVTLLERFTTIGSVAPVLGTMIGLGVGIDYSLFVVSRYRQNLATGMTPDAAVANAIGTAGSAVLFAGATVCIATLGLAVAGIPYLTTLGWVAALVVAIMVVAALTLLPALLGWAGPRVNAWRIPHLGNENPDGSPFWERWARAVGRLPWVFAIVAVVLLVALALPYTRMRLGFPDDSSQPPGTQQRAAFDLVEDGFGAGTNGALLVTVSFPPSAEGDPAAMSAALGKVTNAILAAPGVQLALPTPPANGVALISVTPTGAPDSAQTQQLVEDLRAKVLPAALEGTGISARSVHVGGLTATLIDLGDRIDDRLPWFILAVVSLSFLLLMVVFRSILVPLQAAVANILSIGAAYGAIVLVFQEGYGRALIALPETVPIVAFVPFMMFAILFGLSMDYEVFLMSRIREEWLKTHDHRDAIAVGISMTARVITSAALIMISVFLAFVTNAQPAVKMMGFGLAVAVFVDATIVRLLFVPSTLELMGPAAWWFPKWLDRILPRIELEGASADTSGPAHERTTADDVERAVEHAQAVADARRVERIQPGDEAPTEPRVPDAPAP